jgi:cobalt-precorrin 5A hydrolase
MHRSVLVLTDDGLRLARRLRDAWAPDARIYAPACIAGACVGPRDQDVFETPELGLFGWRGPLRRFFPTIWQESEAIVAVMALGVVARLVGPLACDKRRDPAVVVVDECGRFAISLLGGHGAGANTLARQVAALLGAEPVITTASDRLGLPAVDEIGHDLGWKIDRPENLTRIAAAVVRRQPIVVHQDAGSPDWWRRFGSWPEHFRTLPRIDDWQHFDPAGVLIISDRTESAGLPEDRTVYYRPPTLLAGIGCRRGIARAAIQGWLRESLEAAGWAFGSLAALATVILKADEPGLIELARELELPLLAFSSAELALQPGTETPSERVRAHIGITGVSEPAALRAAGASRLAVPKRIGLGVTVALARTVDGLEWCGYQAK